MRFFKRTGILLLTLLVTLAGAFAGTLTARADILYVPDDDFYQEHYTECETVESNYIAVGAGQEVIIYESPISPRKMGTVENGSAVYIYCTYTGKGGTVWGFCDDEIRGWVPMAYLLTLEEYSKRSESGEELVNAAVRIIPDSSREKKAAAFVGTGLALVLVLSLILLFRMKTQKSKRGSKRT